MLCGIAQCRKSCLRSVMPQRRSRFSVNFKCSTWSLAEILQLATQIGQWSALQWSLNTESTKTKENEQKYWTCCVRTFWSLCLRLTIIIKKLLLPRPSRVPIYQAPDNTFSLRWWLFSGSFQQFSGDFLFLNTWQPWLRDPHKIASNYQQKEWHLLTTL